MYTRMLIPVDGSPPNEHAAKVALAFAQRLNSSAVFAHVSEPQRYRDLRDEKEAFARANTVGQMLLEHWEREAKLKRLDVKTVFKEQQEQVSVAETLLEVCSTEKCDLIVLGTHGRRGLSRMLLGSVAERVARLAQVPVLLVRGDDPQPKLFKSILLATDGSPYSEKALEHADQLTQALNAKLTLLNVAVEIGQMPAGLGRAWMYTDTRQVQKQIDEYIAHLKEQGQAVLEAGRQRCQSQKVNTVLREGRHRLTSEVVCAVADEIKADLIVMGTHGYTGLRKFLLGSVASEVAHHATQPVLLVRNLEVH